MCTIRPPPSCSRFGAALLCCICHLQGRVWHTSNESVQWSGASLRRRHEGTAFAQVITPCRRMTFRHNGNNYEAPTAATDSPQEPVARAGGTSYCTPIVRSVPPNCRSSTGRCKQHDDSHVIKSAGNSRTFCGAAVRDNRRSNRNILCDTARALRPKLQTVVNGANLKHGGRPDTVVTPCQAASARHWPSGSRRAAR